MMETHVSKGIDVLVIGGGIAATMAAIKAKEAGAGEVVMVTKGHVGKGGNSAFAAGVLHVVHARETDKDKEDRLRRLARAQGFLAQQDMIQDHLEDSWPLVQELESYGVEFEKTAKGEIETHAGRGAHPVVMFHGRQLMHSVMRAARKKGVKLINHVMFTDLLKADGRVIGAVGFSYRTGDFYRFEARATILATGSTWYKGIMVGHRDNSGEGFIAPLRAGAILSGAESNDEISHAMPARFEIGPGLNMFQGLGGKLLNGKGERFMGKYVPTLKERAGLRNLMYAFIFEILQGNGPIFFDFTHFRQESIERMRRVIPIPMVMFERAHLLQRNKFVAPVEWMLCPPIGRPGLVVTREFASTLPGLFACGENATVWAVVTGMASAATSGIRAGKAAARFAREVQDGHPDSEQVQELEKRVYAPLKMKNGVLPSQILLSVQENIIPYNILLLQKADRMKEALKRIEYVRDNHLPLLQAYDPHQLRTAHEVSNMLSVAEIHLKTALFRTESRVAIREDFPYTDNKEWLKWVQVQKNGEGLNIFTRDVPIQDYPFQVKREKDLHYMLKTGQELGLLKISGGSIQWALER